MSRAAVFALVLSLSTLPATAQQVQKEIWPTCQSVREQDSSTGAVVQKTRLVPQPFSFDPLLVWTSDDPDSLMFVAMGNGRTLKYAGCFDLTLLADGQPVTLGKLRHDSDPGAQRTVVEYVRTEIPWSDARKLAAAGTITYKICKDEYRADSEFICEAKHLIAAAEAWKREHPAKK
ncbi:MAG TPA: hypothetical protein VGH73_15290 [Thermoanaerobaculia bacterium]|jgi:hypothetical protein